MRDHGPNTEQRGPLVPHQTRVVVRGKASGVVLSVRNARRRLVGVGSRVDEPAMVTVILDSGKRVVEPVSVVEVEVVSDGGLYDVVGRSGNLAMAVDRAGADALAAVSGGTVRPHVPVGVRDPGDECDRECCS